MKTGGLLLAGVLSVCAACEVTQVSSVERESVDPSTSPDGGEIDAGIFDAGPPPIWPPDPNCNVNTKQECSDAAYTPSGIPTDRWCCDNYELCGATSGSCLDVCPDDPATPGGGSCGTPGNCCAENETCQGVQEAGTTTYYCLPHNQGACAAGQFACGNAWCCADGSNCFSDVPTCCADEYFYIGSPDAASPGCYPWGTTVCGGAGLLCAAGNECLLVGPSNTPGCYPAGSHACGTAGLVCAADKECIIAGTEAAPVAHCAPPGSEACANGYCGPDQDCVYYDHDNNDSTPQQPICPPTGTTVCGIDDSRTCPPTHPTCLLADHDNNNSTPEQVGCYIEGARLCGDSACPANNPCITVTSGVANPYTVEDKCYGEGYQECGHTRYNGVLPAPGPSVICSPSEICETKANGDGNCIPPQLAVTDSGGTIAAAISSAVFAADAD